MNTASSGDVIITGPPKSCEFQNSTAQPAMTQDVPPPGGDVAPSPSRVTGSGSGCWIRRMPIADSRNDTASTASVAVAPTRLTSAPPIAGPMLSVSPVRLLELAVRLGPPLGRNQRLQMRTTRRL